MSKDRSALRKAMESVGDAPRRNGMHPVEKLTGLSPERGVIQVPLDHITANPDQPRKFFKEEPLSELADSIRDKGVLQPITVRADTDRPGHVIIIAGERRYRAAQRAGLSELPCLVRDGDDAREVALIENVQRENLTPLEEAEALRLLKVERSYNDEKLAAVIGKSRQSISETLQLTGLPEQIKTDCRTFGNVGKIQLLQVLRAGNEEKQLALWEAIKTGKLPTARAARDATKKNTSNREKPFSRPIPVPELNARVTVSFKKTKATDDEVRAALQGAIDQLA